MDPTANYRVIAPPHLLTSFLHDFMKSKAGHDFTRLSRLLPSHWRTHITGGLLRDFLLRRERGMTVELSDVDVVVGGAPSLDSLRRRLGTACIATNSFGGAKCQMRSGGTGFDVWRIEDHTNMMTVPKPHTIEQFLQHNLLDVDAILWDPRTGCLHDYGCQAAVANARIDLTGYEGISRDFLAAQLAHVLIVKFKTGFRISSRLQEFMVTAWEASQPTEVMQIIERKLPNALKEMEILLEDLPHGAAAHGQTEPRRRVSAN